MRSKREIPRYYLSTTIDLQSAMNWLADEYLNRPVTRCVQQFDYSLMTAQRDFQTLRLQIEFVGPQRGQLPIEGVTDHDID